MNKDEYENSDDQEFGLEDDVPTFIKELSRLISIDENHGQYDSSGVGVEDLVNDDI